MGIKDATEIEGFGGHVDGGSAFIGDSGTLVIEAWGGLIGDGGGGCMEQALGEGWGGDIDQMVGGIDSGSWMGDGGSEVIEGVGGFGDGGTTF